MSRISSLTDTIDFISPQSCGVTTKPLDEDDAVVEADEADEVDAVDDGEHAAARIPAATRPAAATVNLV